MSENGSGEKPNKLSQLEIVEKINGHEYVQTPLFGIVFCKICGLVQNKVSKKPCKGPNKGGLLRLLAEGRETQAHQIQHHEVENDDNDSTDNIPNRENLSGPTGPAED